MPTQEDVRIPFHSRRKSISPKPGEITNSPDKRNMTATSERTLTYDQNNPNMRPTVDDAGSADEQNDS